MSHDLKTPITRLRLRAELLDDARAAGEIRARPEEMEAMVARTLDFMRGLEQDEAVQPIDVMALLQRLQDECGRVRRRGADRGRGRARLIAAGRRR